MKRNKTLLTLVGCLTLAFAVCGAGFTTRAAAQEPADAFSVSYASTLSVERDAALAMDKTELPDPEQKQTDTLAIEPRFGGKSSNSQRLYDTATGKFTGITLYIKGYAENFVWPFYDTGHAYMFVNYAKRDNELDFNPYLLATVNISMQYCWVGLDSTKIHSGVFRVELDETDLRNVSESRYPYKEVLISFAEDYNDTPFSSTNCHRIIVTATVSYLNFESDPISVTAEF